MRAGDKVAERHPYSVYRRNEMDKYTDVRQQDPFTTSFGEGLPFRTYDRNFRARKAASAVRTMEQPYPRGYTGHVGKIRHVVGQTYGQQVREAINSVTQPVDLAVYDPYIQSPNPSGGIRSKAPASEATVSTQQLAYRHPDDEVNSRLQRVADAVPTRKPVDNNSRYASTSGLAYQPPPPKSYATPGFSEKPTSNIGQPDVYKHAARHTVNRATLPRSLTATGSTMDVWAKPTIEKPIMSTTSSRGSGTITMGPAAAELLK